MLVWSQELVSQKWATKLNVWILIQLKLNKGSIPIFEPGVEAMV
jgi:hypothetical protein